MTATQFNTLEELERIRALLGEADFEEAGCRWEPEGAVFTLSTSRPAGGGPRPAGLLRKGGRGWARCRLVFRNVRRWNRERFSWGHFSSE